MNPEQENFEGLTKLLALKRHEQPPPRYFDQLSSNVLDHLREAQAQQAIPWWESLRMSLDWRQALAYSAGLAACGMIAAGMLSSSQTNPAASAVPIIGDSPAGVWAGSPGLASMVPGAPVVPDAGNSTNPVLAGFPWGDVPVRPETAQWNFGRLDR